MELTLNMAPFCLNIMLKYVYRMDGDLYGIKKENF